VQWPLAATRGLRETKPKDQAAGTKSWKKEKLPDRERCGSLCTTYWFLVKKKKLCSCLL